ncbi:MAG TPA: DNA recombination protein RmuC [Jiangellales bacterium]|nr:DNA recombination protein RmuC [Jiangellales bacterium]
MAATDLVLVLLGALLGALLAVLVVRTRSAATLAALAAERDAVRREVEVTRAERDDSRRRAEAAERYRAAAEAEARGAGARLEAERLGAERRLTDLREQHEQLAQRFRALSSEVLEQTQRQFLELAEERLARAQQRATGELDQRRQAIDELLAPMRESLGKVETQLGSVEKERATAYAELRQQVESMGRTSEQLRTETAQLVAALRAPQVRGRWGEIQLRRVVESAGMVEHCDFVEQASVDTPDGRLRPDLIVQLAGGKRVVVDSKVAFSGYLEAMEARDDATRARRLSAHARHLRGHVDDLGNKRYWEQFQPTPEFVVMFVPAEVFLNAALEHDPGLLEHAFERNVVIATPATLIALLRTIAYSWRQEALARNAADVLRLGQELHGRLSTLGEKISKLGRQINGAVKAYNETVASLESRVLVTARKMVDLRVADAEIPVPSQVEAVAREVQAPELVASATPTLVPLEDIGLDPRYGLTAGPRDDADEDAASGRAAGA